MHFQIISASMLVSYMSEGYVLLLDLRSYEAFYHGHIPGAIWAVPEKLSQEICHLLKDYQHNHHHRANHIVLYCDTGHTSLTIARELASHGISVMSLHGGIASWKSRQLPIE